MGDRGEPEVRVFLMPVIGADIGSVPCRAACGGCGNGVKRFADLFCRNQRLVFVDQAFAAGAAMDRIAVFAHPAVRRRLHIEARIEIDGLTAFFQLHAVSRPATDNQIDRGRA